MFKELIAYVLFAAALTTMAAGMYLYWGNPDPTPSMVYGFVAILFAGAGFTIHELGE